VEAAGVVVEAEVLAGAVRRETGNGYQTHT
jgi:hypothetical protein